MAAYTSAVADYVKTLVARDANLEAEVDRLSAAAWGGLEALSDSSK